MRFIKSIFSLFCLILLTSCKEEPPFLEKSIENKNRNLRQQEASANLKGIYLTDGILHFDNIESYIDAINEISSSSNSNTSLSIFENKGFKSFYKFYDENLKQLDQQKQEVSADKIKNNRYIEFRDGVPRLKFVNESNANIANENGMFFVGNSLVRFIGDTEIVVKNGSIKEALDWSPSVSNKNIDVFFCNENESSLLNKPTSAIQANTTCTKLSGSVGIGGEFGNISWAETSAKRISIPLGYSDQYKVTYQVSHIGKFQRGWFGSNSENNSLTVAYTCNVYNWDNLFIATRYNKYTITNTGHEITYQDPVIDAGQCYSFQTSYYRAYFGGVSVPQAPWVDCNLSPHLCDYHYTTYTNDRATVVTSCQ